MKPWLREVIVSGASIALGGLVVWAVQRAAGAPASGASRPPAPAPLPPLPAPAPPAQPPAVNGMTPPGSALVTLSPGVVPSVVVSGQGGQLTIAAPPGGTITALTNGAGQFAQVNAASWSKTYTPTNSGLSGTFTAVWVDGAGNPQASVFGVSVT